MYLNAQDFDSELKLIDENITFGNIEVAESQIKRILDKDPSYAPAYVSLSKISLMKADNNHASKNANLATKLFDSKNSFEPIIFDSSPEKPETLPKSLICILYIIDLKINN